MASTVRGHSPTCTFRSENIEATPDPFAEFSITQGQTKVKLREFVDGT